MIYAGACSAKCSHFSPWSQGQCRPRHTNIMIAFTLTLQPFVMVGQRSVVGVTVIACQRLKIFQTFQSGAGAGWDSRRAAWARARARTSARSTAGSYLSVEESLPLSFSTRPRPHSPLSPRTRRSHRSSSPYSFSRSRNTSEPEEDMVGHLHHYLDILHLHHYLDIYNAQLHNAHLPSINLI